MNKHMKVMGVNTTELLSTSERSWLESLESVGLFVYTPYFQESSIS